MHELFISYCRHDSDAANALADTLSKAGLSVWLDRKAIQEGDAFDTQIEEAIAQTRVVIVIWSEHSVKSHWVRAEAAYALGKHKLLPISIDQSEPPLQFMQIQTIDFRYWDRTSNHRAFQQLAAALAKRLEASAVSTGAQPRSLSHTLAALSADAVEHPAKTRLEAWIAAAGLRFPETVVEKEYQDYFCEKTFIVAQFAMLLAGADLRGLWRCRHGNGIRRRSIHQVSVHDRVAVDGDVLCVEFQTLRAPTLAGFHHRLRRRGNGMHLHQCIFDRRRVTFSHR
jgi:hypothetical protein